MPAVHAPPLPVPEPGIKVVLVRHGETADNLPPYRFQGRRDPPLNETGRGQAEALAATVPTGYRALWCSDLTRARQTAEALAPRLGLEPHVDERLSESFRGRWEGFVMDDVAEAEPELWKAWRETDPDFRFPGGESLAEHRERALAAVAEILAGPLPAIAVCHGGTIRALVEQDLRHFHRMRIPNCSWVNLEF